MPSRATTEHLFEARTHLYIALVQSLPSDDQIIIGHIRDALRLLGGPMPYCERTVIEARAEGVAEAS